MMNNNPLFSIILPTYNQSGQLSKAIMSVLAQTVLSWELIIINNFSEDDTIEVVNSFKDPRIKLLNYSNDGIIARSRNIGAAKSKGEYIAFLDSDDHWREQKLEMCLQSFSDCECDLICHGETWDFNGKKTVEIQYFLKAENLAKHLVIFGNKLSTSAVVVRKPAFSKVGGFCVDQKIVTAEDYDLWIRLAQSNNKFCFIEKALGTYLFHQQGASKKIFKARLAAFNVHRRHITNYTKASSLWTSLFVFKLFCSAIKETYISIKY